MKESWLNTFFPFRYIWQRYFLRQAARTFFLFLFGFYALFVLIDLSTKTAAFHHHVHFVWDEMLLHYAAEFIKLADVLIPFGLLLAVIKTLTQLNTHNELTALLAGGYSLKTLMRPFIFMALFFVGVLYLNTEVLLPTALQKLKHIHAKHHDQKFKKYNIRAARHLVLEDESTVLFQDYDPVKQAFLDVYWIRSFDDIYRIQSLYPYTEVPLGQYVDHFKRDTLGALIKRESAELRLFPEIRFNEHELLETLSLPEELALSELLAKLPQDSTHLSEKEAQFMTTYYYKLAMPWLCLLAVLGPIPYCIRYTRNFPLFLLYAGGLFCLVGFYLIVDASLILGERQALPPFWAIAAPFALFFAFFGLKYVRLR